MEAEANALDRAGVLGSETGASDFSGVRRSRK
jgi:hypothetical protein